MQGEHPVAMHTLAMLYLNSTQPLCRNAIGYLQNLAFRKPCSHHVAFGRHAWARGDAHRAFWHFLAAGEAGAEIALMNAHWILARGCAATALPLSWLRFIRGSPWWVCILTQFSRSSCDVFICKYIQFGGVTLSFPTCYGRFACHDSCSMRRHYACWCIHLPFMFIIVHKVAFRSEHVRQHVVRHICKREGTNHSYAGRSVYLKTGCGSAIRVSR